MGVITIEEGDRERSAIEGIMQAMSKPGDPLLPTADGPATRSGSSKSTGSSAGKSSSKPTKSGSGKPGVHIGSFKTQAQAEKDWESLKKKHSDVLGKLQPSYSKADIKGKGTFIRLKAGPMASSKAAKDACVKLKAKKQFCDATTL
jgi:cell division septation protein DedD